ncbi:hypothetical protein, partial [Sulfitobacter donghicola]
MSTSHDLSLVKNILADFAVSQTKSKDVWKIRMGGADVLMLAEGFDRVQDSAQGFLVGFSGAIANVQETSGPYFVGQSIAKTLKVPILSFSDPTMERNPSLSLGFHAGNNKVRKLPVHMGRAINCFTERLGRPAVLFGGSGGGFAALNTLQHCGPADRAVVWNPQTSIASYDWPAFRAYARAAFPGIAAGFDLKNDSSAPALEAEISKTGCVIRLDPSAKRGQVLYFQNASDRHHMTQHMAPFCEASPVQRVEQNAVSLPAQNLHVCVGNWGKGHAPLPRDLVLHSFKGMLAGRSTAQVQREVMKKMDPDRHAPALAMVDEIRPQDVQIDTVRTPGIEVSVAP